MDNEAVLKDISLRTDGDIYLGVVGAVRTGKSTFIKRFMERVVLPHISDFSERERTKDELPQSAKGRTIMTTEPKFVPNQAVQLSVDEGFDVRVRLVDCVGYIIDEAQGFEDEHGPRMIHTPWFDEAIPFKDAAEIGTRKVIQDHSTIGVVLSTDGSFGEIPRSHYVEAEEKVVSELKDVGKPFIMVLNTTKPTSEDTLYLRDTLKDQYDIPVIPLNVEESTEEELYAILREALFEFPVLELNVQLPEWVLTLSDTHWLRQHFNQAISETLKEIKRLRDVEEMIQAFRTYDYISEAHINTIEMGQGIASIDLDTTDDIYDRVLTEMIGEEIESKAQFLKLMHRLTLAEKEYREVEGALQMVKQTGYGVSSPQLEDMSLDEPEIIKQGQRYEVKLHAKAPSIHMIKVDVTSEFAPIIGTESQGEELIRYLMQDYEQDPLSIWDREVFGRSLSAIVRDGIQAKIGLMPENAREKLQLSLTKIVNEGHGGLIAIVL